MLKMPWSSLTSTKTVRFQKVVRAPLHEAVVFLHSPSDLIDLNPLVKRKLVSEDNPLFYTITDKLTFLGWSFESTYTAQFTLQEDGTDCVVCASAGTKLSNTWRARAVEGHNVENPLTEVSEEVTIEANVFLLPFAISSLRSGHTSVFEGLTQKLEGRLEGGKGDATPDVDHSSNPIMLRVPLLVLFASVILWYFGILSLTWAIVSVVVTFIFMISYKGEDPYDSFHVALNASLSQIMSGTRPSTEWLNMGYWKDTTDFPKACEALALKLVRASGCREGGRVLDVGHGSGDSLLLHLYHPSVPRPARLTGITSLRAHYERSLERIHKVQSKNGAPETEVSLYHGDAVYHPSTPAHPLDPTSDSPSFTTILALDCAYHFRTRRDFLRQGFSRLEQGGKIALADLCFTDRTNPVTVILRLLGTIPSQNIVTIEEFVRILENIGYVDISIEDISQVVFPGFCHFLAQRGMGWKVFSWVMSRVAASGVRFVIVTGEKPTD